jgi:hypothetical protein
MKSARWKEVERLCNAAMDTEPSRRPAFLDKACVGDKSLRAEVESLLAHGERAGSFIESPAIEMVAQELASDGSPLKEEQIVHPAADEIITRRKRAPWWMYAIAAVFLIVASISYYGFIIESERPDLPLKLVKMNSSGKVIEWNVLAVEPDSALARAGVQPGDILGESYRNFLRPRSWEVGRRYPIEIKRNGESKTVFIVLRRNMLVKWSPFELCRHIYFLASPLFLILAVMVAFRRPYEATTRWGSLSMGIWAIVIAVHACSSWSLSYVYLKLPHFMELLHKIFPIICSAILMSAGIAFFAVFPRRLFQRRWIWALIWLPSVIIEFRKI